MSYLIESRYQIYHENIIQTTRPNTFINVNHDAQKRWITRCRTTYTPTVCNFDDFLQIFNCYERKVM